MPDSPPSPEPAGHAPARRPPPREIEVRADSQPGGSLRPSTPVCPRCDSALEAARHPTGIAWRCHSCGGQSLNFSQFRRMIPEAQVDEIWVTTTAKPVAAPNRTLCPECRRPMSAVLIPLQNREMELDICRSCQRLWLESQEKLSKTLDSLHSGPAAAKGPRPPLVNTARRGMDDAAHQDHLEKLARVQAFLIREKSDRRPFLAPLIVLAVLFLLFHLLGKR